MDLNWNLLAQSLVIGLASGSLIALIALGYTIVYGIVEIINFAHGEVFMMGAVCAMTIVAATGVTPDSAWPALVGTAILAFVAASFFSAGINFGMDKVAYRRLRRSPRLAPLITAIGFSFILQNIGIYWIGSNTEKPNPIFAQKYRTYNVLNEWFGLDTSIRIRLLDLAAVEPDRARADTHDGALGQMLLLNPAVNRFTRTAEQLGRLADRYQVIHASLPSRSGAPRTSRPSGFPVAAAPAPGRAGSSDRCRSGPAWR